MKIAFIGLGNMGTPMVNNLMNAGHELILYNRTAQKADPFIERGARLAKTPMEAARDCEIIFTMLSNDAAVEEIVFGSNGILDGLAKDAIHISTSTLSVEFVKKMASAHESKGQHYLSAPVQGRPDAAASATLRILLAGPEHARKRVMPVLESLGSEIFEIGDESEKGNVAKLCMNFLLISIIDSLAQAQNLIKKYGVDPGTLMDVVNSFYQSPPIQNYGNILREHRFAPGFKMTLAAKDMGLALDSAQGVDAPLPTCEIVKEHLDQGIKNGHGDMDSSALLLNYIDADE